MDFAVLQFGCGRFLRGFVEPLVGAGTVSGQAIGGVLAVQSSPDRRAAEQLLAQGCRYQVLERGLEGGVRIEKPAVVEVIRDIVFAADEWNRLLEASRNPCLRWVVSNTTEAGLQLDEADAEWNATVAPASFPAKLASLLECRHRAGGAPLVIAPCELVPENGLVLRDLVCRQARRWRLPGTVIDWMRESCTWLDTLVDRMVTSPPAGDPAARDDPSAVVVEPFQLWAIARPADGRSVPFFEHPAVQWFDDLEEVALRKIRILNGCHTAMVAKALHAGVCTVRDVMESPPLSRWIKDLAYEEVLPTLTDRGFACAAFCETTFERFSNPFAHHRLADIALNHRAKVRTRLEPTLADFRRIFGRQPSRLTEAVAATIA